MKGKPLSKLKELQLSINQSAKKIVSEREEFNSTISMHHNVSMNDIYEINKQLSSQKIKTLDLKNTQLSVDHLIVLAKGIAQCPTLTHVDLSNNNNLTNLTFKDGSSAHNLDLINFNEIFSSCALESIAIQVTTYNPLMEQFKNFVASNESLKQIDISNSQLSAEDFQAIASTPSLEKLIIENTPITQHGIVAGLPNILEEVSIQEVLIKSLMSNPNLVIKVDPLLANAQEIVRDIGEASFLQQVTNPLPNLPEVALSIILDYAADESNYLELSGSVFIAEGCQD